MKKLLVAEFLENSTNGVIIDVRTPAEFEQGHIANAINIPLFSDEERVVVGTIYKQIGKDEAIEKGLEFVGVKMADMVREAKKYSNGKPLYLYCWRGGMRSGSVAWLFSTAGIETYLLTGGYKAYRRDFDVFLEKADFKLIILSGATGCGKTAALKLIRERGEQVIDLEGLANHKGSVFGGFGQEKQPTTEEFINRLHHQFREYDTERVIWCEGESMLIGHVYLPRMLYDKMQISHKIVIEMTTEQRLDRLMVEYGEFSLDLYEMAFNKIRKRNGSDVTDQAINLIKEGDILEAAKIALAYYDKSYRKGAISQDKLLGHITIDNSDMSGSVDRILALKPQNI